MEKHVKVIEHGSVQETSWFSISSTSVVCGAKGGMGKWRVRCDECWKSGARRFLGQTSRETRYSSQSANTHFNAFSPSHSLYLPLCVFTFPKYMININTKIKQKFIYTIKADWSVFKGTVHPKMNTDTLIDMWIFCSTERKESHTGFKWQEGE